MQTCEPCVYNDFKGYRGLTGRKVNIICVLLHVILCLVTYNRARKVHQVYLV